MRGMSVTLDESFEMNHLNWPGKQQRTYHLPYPSTWAGHTQYGIVYFTKQSLAALDEPNDILQSCLANDDRWRTLVEWVE